MDYKLLAALVAVVKQADSNAPMRRCWALEVGRFPSEIKLLESRVARQCSFRTAPPAPTPPPTLAQHMSAGALCWNGIWLRRAANGLKRGCPRTPFCRIALNADKPGDWWATAVAAAG